MNKKAGILLGIALMLLFVGIAIVSSSATSHVKIYAFDQNPAGSDEGNEWVTFHNPSNKSVDIGNWTFESTHGTTAIDWIAEGTTIYPGAYCTYTPHYRWLNNNNESLILRNAKGEEVDRTPVVSDNENDNRYWMRNNSEWTFGVRELEKGELWSGYVKNVVDGDTVDVSFNIYGIQRVRLVGIDAPGIGEEGYEEAKEFVNRTCLGEAIKLDVDDREQFDTHYRILAVVYVNGTNLNEKLVKEGYAEVMYIPPSEFDPYEWIAENFEKTPKTSRYAPKVYKEWGGKGGKSKYSADHPSICYLPRDTLNTITEVAAILFALLGGFVMHYMLSCNETIIEHLGRDYHCLRSTLHLFNYKPLYENPHKSKEILAPILDYLAYVCQLGNISAVQGGNLRKNVLEAWPLFANEENLKEHFLETAKKLDESRGKVRALPSGLFSFVQFILIVLAGTTLVGLWIMLIFEPPSFNPLFFAFYAVLSIFFVLFFAYISDLKRIDTFFVILPPYDFLKWQFIRCLIFADNKGKDGPVKQYLEKAKCAYEDYTNLNYVQETTRSELLDKAKEVAEQFLKKRAKRNKDWEQEVEGMVPWAAIKALSERFRKWYIAFIVVFSAILICPSFICSYFFQLSFLDGLVILALSILGLVFFSFLFLRLLGEKKPIPRRWIRGVKIVSFLENLHKCWDEIIEQNNKVEDYKKKKKKGEVDKREEEAIYEEVLKSIRECIENHHRGDMKRKHV